jgi:hypothetical protein
VTSGLHIVAMGDLDHNIFEQFMPARSNLRKENNMPRYISNAGKHWTSQQVRQLRQMATQNTPTRVIGLKLGRPVAGVYAKAAQKNISLRPTNESPYNRSP